MMSVDLLLILRVALYVQFSLGIGRFFGLITGRGLWDIHTALGIAIVIMAWVAFRPRPDLRSSNLRRIAQYVALLPLALGLLMLFNVAGGLPTVILHMALGILTIGLIEGAAAEQRQARR